MATPMNWQYRHTVLLLCMLAFFMTYVSRLAISPVVPFIIDDFEVSNTAIGVALSGMWLAYGLAQFPSGILADRFGERRVILCAVGGTTLLTVVLTLTPVFPAFVLVTVLLGLAAGLHYSPATALLSRTFDNLGTAVGIHSVGGPLAGLVAPVAVAWVGLQYGWRPAIALVALLGIPIFLLVIVFVRPTAPRRPEQQMRSRLKLTPLVALLSRPSILLPLIIAMIGTYVAQGLLSFLPTFLVEFRGFSPEVAGVIFSLFFFVRAASQMAIGRLSDYIGRDGAIAIAMGAGTIGLASIVLTSGSLVLILAVALAGVGSSFFSAIDPRFIDALGDAERGAGFGLVRTAYTVVGSAGSLGVGIAADAFGWGISFGILGVLLGLSVCILVCNTLLDTGY